MQFLRDVQLGEHSSYSRDRRRLSHKAVRLTSPVDFYYHAALAASSALPPGHHALDPLERRPCQ